MRVSPSFISKWDLWIFMSGIVLVLVSLLAMASAAAHVNPALFSKHLVWILLGLVVCTLASFIRPVKWTNMALVIHAVALSALLIVLLAGTMRLGATRWLSVFGFSLQPSELMKLGVVCLLARYLSGQNSPLSSRSFWMSLLLVLPAAGLIFLQPDLGTASVIIAIWLVMVWVAGAARRDLIYLGLGLVALIPVGWHFLKGYQQQRLLSFIDPHADPLGAGYTVIQSTIGIGSGGVLGKGWFAGTQNQLSFLPERHSDFIFSVIGEEWGLLGCLVVLIAFGVLLIRCFKLVRDSIDPQARLLAAGIGAWLGYQAVVNMGMVMGLLPVVGVPLPLISYGGSSMVTIWIAIGLLQAVHRSRSG